MEDVMWQQNIRLKDNVELRIETGAVIWQSPRPADYAYDVVYGHDVSIPGVNWTHAASCHNMPLIHGDQVSNVRVTGRRRNPDAGRAAKIWTVCLPVRSGRAARIKSI